jgi:hypothetical protein
MSGWEARSSLERKTIDKVQVNLFSFELLAIERSSLFKGEKNDSGSLGKETKKAS